MRVQPNMTVLSPCDSEEARKATCAAAAHAGPVYIRLAREKTPLMTAPETPFEIGKAIVMWESDHAPEVAVFATGPLVYHALVAAKELEHTVPVIVVNVHTIKPLDPKLAEIAKNAGAVVTVEEHQVAGGLGSAITELLASGYPLPTEFIGVHDQFGQSGEPAELLTHYKMDAPAIIDAIKKAQQRRVRAD
jgi:transketolase